MDGQPSTQPEIGQTSDPIRDVTTTTVATQSIEDRLAAHDSQLTEILQLLRAQAATAAATAALVPTVPVAPTVQTSVAPTTSPMPTDTPLSETRAEGVSPAMVIPLKTSTLTPLPMTTEQPTATTVPATSAFTLTPEAKLVREFMKFQPGYFYGGGDPEAGGKWIVSHERFHKLMRNDDRVQARLSGACLRGNAAVWWMTYLDIHPEPATWAEFRELFYDEFIPMPVRLRLREDFLALRQGNRSLMQYMEQDRYLLRFSMDVAGTETLQIYYFVRGVDERIADAIVSTGATTLQEVYDRALSYETLLLERRADDTIGHRKQTGRVLGRSKARRDREINLIEVVEMLDEIGTVRRSRDSRPKDEDRQADACHA
ncbi:hypothetical protein Syun_006273 [Stephania yunnanensis]|uniref:Retrotransposon gag domain-containing protein n=1 Tax=Stephania yunnanensis TaxID=152371 RepID=A0AAP0KXY5_9MAGN